MTFDYDRWAEWRFGKEPRVAPHWCSAEAFCLSLGTVAPVFYVRRPAKVHPEAYAPRVVTL